jgi:hypothetical protein
MAENLGRQDLSGLGGLLSRRQAPRPAPTVAPLAPDATLDEPAAVPSSSTVAGLQAEPATSSAPRRRTSSRKKASEGTAEGELVQVGLQIPRSIADRIRAAKEARTTAAVVIEAINSTHDQLSGRWAVEAPVGPLAPQPTRTPAREGDNVQQMPVRLTRGNLGKLDGLVAEAKAPSRSAYVSAALDAYLPHI